MVCAKFTFLPFRGRKKKQQLSLSEDTIFHLWMWCVKQNGAYRRRHCAGRLEKSVLHCHHQIMRSLRLEASPRAGEGSSRNPFRAGLVPAASPLPARPG